MKIGIIGAGSMGAGLASLWSRAGHEVTVSSRHPASIVATAAQIGHGVRVATIRGALSSADIVVLATPFGTLDEALDHVGSLEDRLVIDTTNPCRWDSDGKLVRMLPSTVSAASIVGRRRPRARLYKAYSTVPAQFLLPGAQHRDGLPLGAYFCGEDGDARRLVGELISDSGFAPIYIGSLGRAVEIEAGGALHRLGMMAAPAARELLRYPIPSESRAA